MVNIPVNGAWSPGFLLSDLSQGSVEERNKEGNINSKTPCGYRKQTYVYRRIRGGGKLGDWN